MNIIILFYGGHTHECNQSIENVKINVDKQLIVEFVENQKEISV